MLTFFAAFLGSLLGSLIYAHFFRRDKIPEMPSLPVFKELKADKIPVSVDNDRLKRWWYGEEEGET